jgi:PPOX class probable F420-dependent enzyme
MSELPDEVRSLLAGPNIAHIATLLPDGSPHSVAVWAGLEGEHAVFFTQESSRKARNLRADPRVAISIVDRANPYATCWIRGRVVGTLGGDEALEVIDRLSVKYTGEPFPMRSGTVFEIEAERAGSMTLPFRPVP